MRLTQCDKYKNHYYDADRYSSCPHCARLSAPEAEEKKKGGFLDRFRRPRTSSLCSLHLIR